MSYPQGPDPSTRHAGTHDISVLPGEVRVATFPTRFIAVLGSSVSVCICDRVHGVGAINHFLLPDFPPAGETDITRWAEPAINALLQKARNAGAHADCLEARVFGGSHISPCVRRNFMRIGDHNVDSAIVALQRHGVHIVSQCTGGDAARELGFESNTGLASVTYIRAGNDNFFTQRETP